VSGVQTEVVNDLNRLMAEEIEAFLRYFQMRFRLRGPGRPEAEAFFAEALKETLEHAESLAEQIQALGHVPTLQIHLALDGDVMRPDEALTEAIDVEQQALDAYTEFLPRVIGDPVLEDFIRKQIEVESEHVQSIRDTIRTATPLTLVQKPAGPSDREA
jgi:bacterioferritin (cytochrome b1)